MASIAPSHVVRLVGTDYLLQGNHKLKVAHYALDADRAIFPVIIVCQKTELAKPKLADTMRINAICNMDCRISDVSWPIAHIFFKAQELSRPRRP